MKRGRIPSIGRGIATGGAVLFLAAALCFLPRPAGAAAAPPPLVLSLDLSDAIQPVTARYVVESLRLAEREGCDLVVLNLDTPGGLMDSTQTIVKAITSSPVPVAVFVSGTRAASAGFFITIAADVAAMAPGTRFGASHPVGLLGGGGGDKKGMETLIQKAENDAAAWIRSAGSVRRHWAVRCVPSPHWGIRTTSPPGWRSRLRWCSRRSAKRPGSRGPAERCSCRLSSRSRA